MPPYKSRKPRRRPAKKPSRAPRSNLASKPRMGRKRAARPARRAIAPVQRLHTVGGVVSASYKKQYQSHRGAHQSLAKQIKTIGQPNTYQLQSYLTKPVAAGRQDLFSFQHVGFPDIGSIRAHIVAAVSVPIRFVLENYISEMTYTNTSTAPLEMEIYDVSVKRDVLAVWNYVAAGGNTYSVSPVPESYWGTGALLGAGLPAGTLTANNPAYWLGSSPFDSQLFKEYFNVTKRTIVNMPQGATHRHVVTQALNYVVTDALAINPLESAVAGLTTFTLMRINGYPSVDSTSTDPSTTTMRTQISAVQSKRYKYTWVQDLTTSIYATQSLPQVEPQVLNVGAGTVDTSSKLC